MRIYIYIYYIVHNLWIFTCRYGYLSIFPFHSMELLVKIFRSYCLYILFIFFTSLNAHEQ